MNPIVTFLGRLACADEARAETRHARRPAHEAPTRAEPGNPRLQAMSDGRLALGVDGAFVDPGTFRRHRPRATAGLRRDDAASGL